MDLKRSSNERSTACFTSSFERLCDMVIFTWRHPAVRIHRVSRNGSSRFPLNGSKKPLMAREVLGIANAFRLQQVAALVARDDFESSAHGETQPGNQRIPEADAVDILGARPNDQFAARFCCRQESDGERIG